MGILIPGTGRCITKADEVLEFIETTLQLEKHLGRGGGFILGIIMQKSIRAQLEAAAHDRQVL